MTYKIHEIFGKGRAMFATQPIKIGATILEEQPLVCTQFSWNATYGYLSCEKCMRPLETAENNVRRLTTDYTISLPHPELCKTAINWLHHHVCCPQCGIKYCCEECRVEALASYHATLCLGANAHNEEHPFNQLNECWKKMHYPPETFSIMLITKIIAMLGQSKDRNKLITIFNEFQDVSTNPDLKIFHKVLGDNFQSQIETLYSKLAALFIEELSWFTLDRFKSLLAMIGTNGQGVGTSPFSEWTKNVTNANLSPEDTVLVNSTIDALYEKLEDIAGQFLDNEGSALYVVQSKINHSCAPNAEIQFPYSNNVISVRAIREIEEDEEICISYLDECVLERSRHTRQKILLENYLFQCECSKCQTQANDPDMTSEEETDDSDDEMDG